MIVGAMRQGVDRSRKWNSSQSHFLSFLLFLQPKAKARLKSLIDKGSSAKLKQGVPVAPVDSSLSTMEVPREMEATREVEAESSSTKQAPAEKEPSDWSWPHVHIVQTRFMQGQVSLTNLARARLELFRIFCLPTMKAQTTQQFLWFIRTDPKLDKSLFNEMVALLKDHPNFYLVGNNERGRPFDEIDVDKIYTGNRTLYLIAKGVHEQKSLPVFETRVDADDGLQVDYLRNVQSRATQSFAREKLNWLVFCAQTAMEWRMYPNETYGFISSKKETICVSAGVTVAFPAGVFNTGTNPGYGSHNKVEKTINNLSKHESCGYNKTSKCLVILNAENSNGSFPVIRSRTPTSTGMADVVGYNKKNMSKEAKKTMDRLEVLHVDYNISRDGLQWLNKYMEEHVVDIAKENLKGQCTKGHSCKVR
jgi:hypothetical protein